MVANTKIGAAQVALIDCYRAVLMALNVQFLRQ
jgi:hypothetical protein